MAVSVGDVALVDGNGQGASQLLYHSIRFTKYLTPATTQARIQYLQSGDTTLQEHTAVPKEFDDPHHHQALAFEYYTEAYGTFLRGSDDFEESEQVLEARYGK